MAKLGARAVCRPTSCRPRPDDRGLLTALYISLLSLFSAVRVMVDKLLAADALVFLVSALLSFVSMRVRDSGTRFEAWGENVFIGALGLLALGALVLRWS